MTLQTSRTIHLSRAAVALRQRGVTAYTLAIILGVAKQSVMAWLDGTGKPSDEHRTRVELLFARLDDRGSPRFAAGGRIESDVPREWWDETATPEAA